MLAMSAVLCVAGCGSEKASETKETAETQETETTEDTAAEESAETKKDASGATRLVSVDDVSKYVTIAEYKGITLDNIVMEVTEDDIDFELEETREEISSGTAQEGDLVTVSFVGTKDGEEFEGGSGDDYELIIGDEFMPEEFEQGIVGMKKGETKEVAFVFPEEYGDEELGGEEVVYQITLQKIMRTPELTDEWVAANTDVSTVEEYRQQIREQLEADAQYYASYDLAMNAWYAVYEECEVIEYPEKDLEEAEAEYRDMYTEYVEEAGMTMEEFVESQGMTMEEFEDDCQIYAEEKVKQNLILQGIMDAEGMSLDDPECLEYQESLISDYGAADLAELIDWFGQAAVDESIALLRVENFIVENAVINEMIGSSEEDAGVNANIEDGIDSEEWIEEDVIYDDEMLEDMEWEEIEEDELMEDVVIEE